MLHQYVLFMTLSGVNHPAASVGDLVSGILHHRNDRHVYLQEQDVRSSQEVEMHVQMK